MKLVGWRGGLSTYVSYTAVYLSICSLKVQQLSYYMYNLYQKSAVLVTGRNHFVEI